MILFLFFFGLCVGSFLNVLIERLPRPFDTAQGRPEPVEGRAEPRGQGLLNVVGGRSRCPECGHVLAWCDLVPLLSFAALCGRCRYCGQKISWQYPLVELATGVLFASFPSFILYSLFLIPIFVIDLKHGIIPDKIVFPAVLVALSAQLLAPSYRIFNLYNNLKNDVGGLGPYLLQTDFFRHHVWLELRPLLWTLLGSFVLCFLFFVLHRLFEGRALGGGDVKLAFLVGLITGWPNMIVAVFSAFLTGALVSVILMLIGKKKFGETVPFGPFLVAGTYVVFFFGEKVLNWYLGLL